MNQLVVSGHHETFNREDMRVVKITSMRQASSAVEFYAELKDEPGIIRKIVGIPVFDTDAPVKAWTGNEGVMVHIWGRGSIKFQNHTMSGPKYPIARIPNGIDSKGNKKFKNVRVTFFVTKDTVVSKTEQQAVRPPVVNEKDIIDIEPVPLALVDHSNKEPTKPVKSDYENFGEYMKACKKYKDDMRKWQAEQEVTA